MARTRLCTLLAIVGGAALIGAPSMAVPLTYVLSPASANIGFAVNILGLATARGEFTKFSGQLTVDLDVPQESAVSVMIDTRSASMAWEPAASMVVGEAYLDVAHYPELQFVSQRVTVLDKSKVRLDGTLTLHGVSRGESFDADLVNRHWNAARGAEEAEFSATGAVHRSDYHMTTSHLLDDRVTITIHARLLLNKAPP